MKKKIAILTLPLGKNYGGLIQNYALQEFLKKNNFEVTTINRRSNKKSLFRSFFSFVKNDIVKKKILRNKVKFTKSEEEIIYSNITGFINKYINITEVINSNKKLKKTFARNNYHAVITGSDQIWRPAYSNFLYNFYLDFLKDINIIKMSYAASFGTEDWEYSNTEERECKRLIKKFNYISVREHTGKYLSKNKFGVTPEVVLDPALLLTANEYIKLFKDLNFKRDGLYNYVLDKNSKKNEFINNISKFLNLEVFSNQPKIAYNKISKNNDIPDYKYPSIESWLKSFHDASFIITDSFHGTVFAILFEKPFLSLVNNERGASRFTSLLSSLSLENRLVKDLNTFDFSIISQEINYESVNKKLDELRIRSYDFLKNLKSND